MTSAETISIYVFSDMVDILTGHPHTALCIEMTRLNPRYNTTIHKEKI